MARPGVFNIPWYATVFRGDTFEGALLEIAPVALRYGATEWEVLRAGDDRYKFTQLAYFESKLDFERYWSGPEFQAWRAEYSSWYQVPVVYALHEVSGRGRIGPEGEPGAQTTAA